MPGPVHADFAHLPAHVGDYSHGRTTPAQLGSLTETPHRSAYVTFDLVHALPEDGIHRAATA